MFSANGKFITEFGSHGRKAGSFQVPHSITLDTFGRIYVADRENHRIQVFESGHETLVWDTMTSKEIPDVPWKQHLSAVHFSHHLQLLAAIDGPYIRLLDRQGRDVTEAFGASEAEWPHDIIMT